MFTKEKMQIFYNKIGEFSQNTINMIIHTFNYRDHDLEIIAEIIVNTETEEEAVEQLIAYREASAKK